MNFDNEIKQLATFQHNSKIPPIIRNLERVFKNDDILFFLGSRSKIDKNRIETLRRELLNVLSEEEKVFGITIHPELGDICHNILLKLAYLSPINNEDPSTLEVIQKTNCICVSTGHQYDINQFIAYHMSRNPHDDENNQNFKIIFNYAINEKCSFRDIAHIKKVAASKNILINDLINSSETDLNLQQLAIEYKQLMSKVSNEEIANHLITIIKWPHLFKSNFSDTMKSLDSYSTRCENTIMIGGKFMIYSLLSTSLFMACYIADLILTKAYNSYYGDTYIANTGIEKIGLLISIVFLINISKNTINACKTEPTILEDIKESIARIA